jgi:hypothetical protein
VRRQITPVIDFPGAEKLVKNCQKKYPANGGVLLLLDGLLIHVYLFAFGPCVQILIRLMKAVTLSLRWRGMPAAKPAPGMAWR